ncbi:hypothetical protein [Nonomuraea sp. NPDC003214]
MGFPDERESGTDSTPRRSRRDRKADADPGSFAGAFTPAGPPPPGGAPNQGGLGGVGGPPYSSGAPTPGGGPNAGGAPNSGGGPNPGGAFNPGGGPSPGGAFNLDGAPSPDGDPDADAPQDEPKRGRRSGSSRSEGKRPRQTWSPYDEENRSRGPLWAVVAGVAVLGLFGGGLAIMFNADDPATTAANSEQRTSAPLPSAPPGEFGYAASRSTDPDPLTVKELFRAKKFTVSGRAYQMTVTSKDKKCADGVLGDKMAKALKSGKCTQMMRASFRDKSGKVIGTVGVANLNTSKSAAKVAKAGGTADYVKPLAGKDEITKFLGSGSGGAKVWAHGHYAVLVWFQSKDGVKPDKKLSKQLFQAAEDITKQTVFQALDRRALTGMRAT